MSGLMKQAQKLQNKMQEMQEELGKRTVSAQAGGGMVEAVVTGRQELLSLRIDPEVANPDDVDMLQDLVLAAVNEALNAPGRWSPRKWANSPAASDPGDVLNCGERAKDGGSPALLPLPRNHYGEKLRIRKRCSGW